MTNLSAAAERAWIRLLRTPAAVLDRVEADLKAAGLPPLEWYDVLLELGREADGRLRQRDLGRRLLVARYNLSRLLDRLETDGLILRETCPEDRRGAIVALTAAGRELKDRMWPVYAAAIARHLADRLDEAELTLLAAILAKLD